MRGTHVRCILLLLKSKSLYFRFQIFNLSYYIIESVFVCFFFSFEGNIYGFIHSSICYIIKKIDDVLKKKNNNNTKKSNIIIQQHNNNNNNNNFYIIIIIT